VKKIEPHHQPFKLDEVKEALQGSRTARYHVTEAKGVRPPEGPCELYRGQNTIVDFLPKVKIEIVTATIWSRRDRRDPPAPPRPGRIGEARSFVSNIEGSDPHPNRRIRAGRYLSRLIRILRPLKRKKAASAPDFVEWSHQPAKRE